MEKSFSVCYVLGLFKVFTNLTSRDKNMLNIVEVSHSVRNSSVVILGCCCFIVFVVVLFGWLHL